MATTLNSNTTFPTKQIRFDRQSRDFAATVIFADGTKNYVGSRATAFEAEQLCDEYVYRLLAHPTLTPTPAQPAYC